MLCTDYVPPKDVARTSTHRGKRLHQLKSDRCVWVKKSIIALAYLDDLLITRTSRDTTSFLEQLRQSLSLKHSTTLISQQPLRFLGKHISRNPNGDITVSLERSCYYSLLKSMDLDDNSNPTSTPSLRRPPAQQDSQPDPDRHHIYRKGVGMFHWPCQHPEGYLPQQSGRHLHQVCALPVLKRYLHRNRIIELHIENGETTSTSLNSRRSTSMIRMRTSATPKDKYDGHKTTTSTQENNNFEHIKSNVKKESEDTLTDVSSISTIIIAS